MEEQSSNSASRGRGTGAVRPPSNKLNNIYTTTNTNKTPVRGLDTKLIFSSNINNLEFNTVSSKCYLTDKYGEHVCNETCDRYLKVHDAVMRAGSSVDQQWLQRHHKLCMIVGTKRYSQLASMAKEGTRPKRLFAWLLNKEIEGSRHVTV